MSTFLEVKNLTKRYHQETVLDSLSFTLETGTNLLIQGPSGCGKSTLLRCIAMLESFDEGCIRLENETISTSGQPPRPNASTRLKVGMVFQHLYLWPHLTVFRNVTLPLTLRGIGEKEADQQAVAMLAEFGLEQKCEAYPHTLSGGQQQRVALARAFVHRPKLLLLDEITSNLDGGNAAKVMTAVESICRQGTTVIMVSHNGQTPCEAKFQVLQLLPEQSQERAATTA